MGSLCGSLQGPGEMHPGREAPHPLTSRGPHPGLEVPQLPQVSRLGVPCRLCGHTFLLFVGHTAEGGLVARRPCARAVGSMLSDYLTSLITICF